MAKFTLAEIAGIWFQLFIGVPADLEMTFAHRLTRLVVEKPHLILFWLASLNWMITLIVCPGFKVEAFMPWSTGSSFAMADGMFAAVLD